MSLRTLTLLTAVLAGQCSLAYTQDAQSAFSAIVINNSTWKSFDVLVEESTFTDRPDGGAITSTIFHRIVFNPGSNTGVYLKLGQGTIFESSDATDKKTVNNRQVAEGWIVDDKSTFKRIFPNGLSEGPARIGFVDLCNSLKAPNPQLFGLTIFKETRQWGGNADALIARERAFTSGYQVLGESIAFELEAANPAPNRKILLTWKCSAGNGLPGSMRLVTRDTEKEKDYPTAEEVLRWGRIGNILVPISIDVENPEVRLNQQNKEVLVLHQSEIKIHWLSINDSPKMEMPDLEVLRDLQRFRNATTPTSLEMKFLKVEDVDE